MRTQQDGDGAWERWVDNPLEGLVAASVAAAADIGPWVFW